MTSRASTMPCRGQFNAPTASVLNALDVAPFSALSASVANAPSVSLFEAPVVSEISALLVSERHAPNRLKLLQMTHQMCQFFARHDRPFLCVLTHGSGSITTSSSCRVANLKFQAIRSTRSWQESIATRSAV